MILLGSIINGAAIAAGAVVGIFGGKLLNERLKLQLWTLRFE